MEGTRIVLIEEGVAPRKVTKIIPYGRGGFGVAVPYHTARKGWVIKFPVDYEKTHIHAPISETSTYTAADRVKLSFHPDGFVQFSGERPGRITSGRDSFGKPKGMGIVINRLGTPLATVGPNFAISLWGLPDFEEADEEQDRTEFDDGDYYYRDCTADDWNAYVIEAFIFPRARPLQTAHISNKGLVASLRFPVKVRSETPSGIVLPSPLSLFEGPDTSIFNLRLIEVPNPPLMIGMMVTRTRVSFDSPSGFVLSGPSDMRAGLMAIYPEPGYVPQLPTLDYPSAV